MKKLYIEIISTSVFLGLASSSFATPLVIDFEDVEVPAYGYTSGVDTTSYNFIFSNPLPYQKGVISDPSSACSPDCASNGTNYLYGQSGFYNMASTEGLTFDLVSFDIAELQPANVLNLTSIEIIGNFETGGTTSYIFNLDGIIDGPGGLSDFETVNILGSFVGLSSVIFTANNSYFAMDNIAVDVATVPEPATLAILILGLFGIGVARRIA